jgi:hypothetical protein
MQPSLNVALRVYDRAVSEAPPPGGLPLAALMFIPGAAAQFNRTRYLYDAQSAWGGQWLRNQSESMMPRSTMRLVCFDLVMIRPPFRMI